MDYELNFVELYYKIIGGCWGAFLYRELIVCEGMQSMDNFDRGIRHIFGQVQYFALFYTC